MCVFQAWVHFYPTVDHQKSCDSCDDNGMNGDLVIVYDVNRNTSLGDIKVHQEFFSSPNIKNISYALSSSNLTFFGSSLPEITTVLCSSLCSI